ncbi:carbohydrate kinase family protein [Candidatus Gracilibacteria bacterium]|nr:carbohydrate kinase family protein [Candidatus Gracilibacteria bacterium]
MNNPMTFDIITFGSITLDILIKAPKKSPIKLLKEKTNQFFKIPLGDKIKIDESIVACGGGAANSATGFSKLGLNTAMFGVMGDKSNRGFLMHELKKAGVCTDFITFAKNETSSFSVILNAWTGDRTVFHHRTMCENFNEKTLMKTPSSRAIYVGHLYTGPDQMLSHIPEWKRKIKGLVGWNPGKTQFKKGFSFFEEIFPSIDVLILNVEEAEGFTELVSQKIKVSDYTAEIIGEKVIANSELKIEFMSDCRNLADKFLSAGIAKVVITDGERGAQVFDGKSHFFSPSQYIQKVDTLGAGDAFSVGILSAILHDKPLHEQILWGNFASNSVIQDMGGQAGQLTLDEMKASINRL